MKLIDDVKGVRPSGSSREGDARCPQINIINGGAAFSSGFCFISTLHLKNALASPPSLQRRALSTAVGYFVPVYPSAETTTTRASLAPDRDPHLDLAAAADSWLAALPSGKRAKLETQLAAAATLQDKWEMLRESAEDDKTKARAARRALLLQEAARALAL